MPGRPAAVVAFVAILASAVPAAAEDCGIPPGTERCARWVAKHPTEGSAGAIAMDAVSSPDGSTLFVTGGAKGASDQDITTIAYDAGTGAARWTSQLPNAGFDQGYVMAISPDGESVYILAEAAGAGTDYRTIALDAADGSEQWSTGYDAAGLSDNGRGIDVSEDGTRVYVTGYSDSGFRASGGTEYDYGTVAYDAESGDQLWARRYDGPANFWDTATDLEAASVPVGQGSRELVFVTGRSNGLSTANQHTDYATVAYDGKTGAQVWVARYEAQLGDRDYPYALAVSEDRTKVFVTGESVSAGTANDYATVAYDALTGAELWVARLSRPQDDRPLDVAERGGRVYVTGFGMNGGHPFDRSAVTVAYDANTGTQLWKSERTGPLGEAGANVSVSPDGKHVYVGGLAAGMVFGSSVAVEGVPLVAGALGISSYLAVAYDAANGDEEWFAHHGGFATDASERSALLSPDGSRFYVTGGELGSFTTVAYDT